jgi:hypothetical protein
MAGRKATVETLSSVAACASKSIRARDRSILDASVEDTKESSRVKTRRFPEKSAALFSVTC